MRTLRNLGKPYGEQSLFQGVSLAVEPREVVALLGESGVGHSTLLNCMACLDSIHASEVRIGGTPIPSLSKACSAARTSASSSKLFMSSHT